MDRKKGGRKGSQQNDFIGNGMAAGKKPLKSPFSGKKTM